LAQSPDKILRSVRNGDYIFTQSIGKGSFGETFRDNDRRGRPVAGKFLIVDPPPTVPANLGTLSIGEQLLYAQLQNSYLTQKLQFERDFSREAATHARLVHPHIVKIRDFDIENGQPYIIMELATAALNRYLITGRPLTPDEAAEFVLQIGKGIQHAHDNEVIHRDLKPGNVLIFENAGGKRLAVTDFGIYLPLHSEKSAHLQKVIGTLAYMAPEQSLGKAVPESDQYALGAMAYEFFTGRKFFTDKVSFQFQDPKAFNGIVQILGIQEEVRPLVNAVGPAILKAVAKEPEDRYTSTITFAEDVKTRLTDARRGRVFEAAKPQEKPGTTLEIYGGHSEFVTSVAWSPDGNSIVSGAADYTTQRWEAVTGNLKTEYKGHRSWVFSVAWSPDGTKIASGSWDTTVQVWVASK
jgi:eukaryotic-like serine/threonine-protein kinase